MPAAALGSIAAAALVALVLAAAVTAVLVRLLRTSAVLGDIDGMLARLPVDLHGLGRSIARVNRALTRDA